jgi:hypothetical protein
VDIRRYFLCSQLVVTKVHLLARADDLGVTLQPVYVLDVDRRVLQLVDFAGVLSEFFLKLDLSVLLEFPESEPVFVTQYVGYCHDVCPVHQVKAVDVIRQLKGLQLYVLDLKQR